MRKFFSIRFDYQVAGTPMNLGGFTSRGAEAVNTYSSPPPPPSYQEPSVNTYDTNIETNESIGSGSGGGKGPDFYCTREELTSRGCTEDVVNCVTQSGILSAWATNALNAAGRELYGDKYIQEYPKDDYVFRGQSQPSSEEHKILRFHEKSGKAGGEWHASIEEMQRKAQLRFNAAAHDTDSHKTAFSASANNITRDSVAVAVSVKKFLDLPGLPKYSSEARFTPTIVEVEISRTVSGKQQVKVENYREGLAYSNEKSTEDLFSWLKFKPGS